MVRRLKGWGYGVGEGHSLEKGEGAGEGLGVGESLGWERDRSERVEEVWG